MDIKTWYIFHTALSVALSLRTVPEFCCGVGTAGVRSKTTTLRSIRLAACGSISWESTSGTRTLGCGISFQLIPCWAKTGGGARGPCCATVCFLGCGIASSRHTSLADTYSSRDDFWKKDLRFPRNMKVQNVRTFLKGEIGWTYSNLVEKVISMTSSCRRQGPPRPKSQDKSPYNFKTWNRCLRSSWLSFPNQSYGDENCHQIRRPMGTNSTSRKTVDKH